MIMAIYIALTVKNCPFTDGLEEKARLRLI
jgi:hypothetical protein